jgi:hypothetical protein
MAKSRITPGSVSKALAMMGQGVIAAQPHGRESGLYDFSGGVMDTADALMAQEAREYAERKAKEKKKKGAMGKAIGTAAAVAAAPFTGGASLTAIPAMQAVGEGVATGDMGQVASGVTSIAAPAVIGKVAGGLSTKAGNMEEAAGLASDPVASSKLLGKSLKAGTMSKALTAAEPAIMSTVNSLMPRREPIVPELPTIPLASSGVMNAERDSMLRQAQAEGAMQAQEQQMAMEQERLGLARSGQALQEELGRGQLALGQSEQELQRDLGFRQIGVSEDQLAEQKRGNIASERLQNRQASAAEFTADVQVNPDGSFTTAGRPRTRAEQDEYEYKKEFLRIQGIQAANSGIASNKWTYEPHLRVMVDEQGNSRVLTPLEAKAINLADANAQTEWEIAVIQGNKQDEYIDSGRQQEDIYEAQAAGILRNALVELNADPVARDGEKVARAVAVRAEALGYAVIKNPANDTWELVKVDKVDVRNPQADNPRAGPPKKKGPSAKTQPGSPSSAHQWHGLPPPSIPSTK